MEYAIYSSNKELLEKARRELVSNGFEDEKEWNDNFFSSYIPKDINYLRIAINEPAYDGNLIAFHNHDCDISNPVEITDSNYSEMLQTIVNSLNSQPCKQQR